jgi:hypothetical protein
MTQLKIACMAPEYQSKTQIEAYVATVYIKTEHYKEYRNDNVL